MTGSIINGSSAPTIRNYYDDGGKVKCNARSLDCLSSTDYTQGASLLLRSKTYSTSQGGNFYLFARQQDGENDEGGALIGTGTGSLYWFSQPVTRYSSVSLSGSPWHIAFDSGLRIQGGNTYINAYGNYTITLPTAFTSTNYTTSITSNLLSVTAMTQQPQVIVLSRATTSFTVITKAGAYTPSTASFYLSWLCVGY